MNAVLRWLRGFAIGTGALIVAFALMQLVPYGNDHSNPPIVQEPNWDHPRTRELAKRACFDCHSNETKWPWYAKLAPFSWVMQRDVDVGRSVMNFSDWQWPNNLATVAGPVVLGTEMPPRKYKLLHDDARLDFDDRVALARGLHHTMGLPWHE